MTPVVTLRPARPDEAERLHRVWRAAVEATHDFLSAQDLEAIDAEVAAFLPDAEAVVAADDADVPLGFLIVSPGRIEGLFVDPAAHRRGVGRALVEDAARRGGPVELEVNEQNPGARRFYERLGFRSVGRSELDGQGRPYPLVRMRREP